MLTLCQQAPAVISLCAYKDVSGLFTTKIEDYTDLVSGSGQSYSGNGFGYMKPEPQNMKIEDEEDLLYGESGSSFQMKNVSRSDDLVGKTDEIIVECYSLPIWQYHRIQKNRIGGGVIFNRKNQHFGFLFCVTMVIWKFILCLT